MWVLLIYHSYNLTFALSLSLSLPSCLPLYRSFRLPDSHDYSPFNHLHYCLVSHSYSKTERKRKRERKKERKRARERERERERLRKGERDKDFVSLVSTTSLYQRLTIVSAATHETEWGDHDFCLRRSHYTDTDPTSKKPAATAGIKLPHQ